MTAHQGLSRRQMLLAGGAGLGVVLLGGLGACYELIEHRVIPGKHELDEIDGTCSVSAPPMTYGSLGHLHTGTFHSRFRRREVTYCIGYPFGHRPGANMPLVVALHGYGGSHSSYDVVRLAALLPPDRRGGAIAPFAFVSVDGGNGYWNSHPGDDPFHMVTEELVPLCQNLGLGRSGQIAAFGLSMGGYGAINFTERRPDLFAACSAISPAVWRSYDEARSANPTAFSSSTSFSRNDVIAHAAGLRRPLRLATGTDDPFYPYVRKLAAALPESAVTVFSKGCHDTGFYNSQLEPALGFLAQHMYRA